MDAFSYLSVLLSIILGLAITEVLQGFRGLMHARSRTIVYWPVIAWGVLVVVIAVQGWWTMFGYRHIEDCRRSWFISSPRSRCPTFTATPQSTFANTITNTRAGFSRCFSRSSS
jgi:hypothetical protein